jgi:hypothetical protein
MKREIEKRRLCKQEGKTNTKRGRTSSCIASTLLLPRREPETQNPAPAYQGEPWSSRLRTCTRDPKMARQGKRSACVVGRKRRRRSFSFALLLLNDDVSSLPDEHALSRASHWRYPKVVSSSVLIPFPRPASFSDDDLGLRSPPLVCAGRMISTSCPLSERSSQRNSSRSNPDSLRASRTSSTRRGTASASSSRQRRTWMRSRRR